MKRFWMLGLLVMAGCAEVADIRASAPVVDVVVTDDWQEVSACLTGKMVENMPFSAIQPRSSPRARTADISVKQIGLIHQSPVWEVTVQDVGNGSSRVQLRTVDRTLAATARGDRRIFTEWVAACVPGWQPPA